MEISNRASQQVKREGHFMHRKTLSGMVITMALLIAGAGVLHGQKAPEPPAPPEPPEPPEVFLLNDGSAHLGVTLSDVSTEKAQELKLPAVAGAIVDHVQKDSPAAKAGLEQGDAIIEFDGIRVRSSAELRRLIRETPVGRTVAIKIVRSGKSHVLSAKLETSGSNFNFNFNVPEVHLPPMNLDLNSMFGSHRATLGIDGDDLTPQLAQYFGVKQGKGVLISEVTVGGAADKAGLKAGDVIVQIDGKAIGSVEELRAALNDNFTDDTRKVSLTIVRDRHEQTINAELTRSQRREKRTASRPDQDFAQAAAQLRRSQAEQERAQQQQARALADQERALVQAEVMKQQAQVQQEWQRQLRQQMLVLKDQLKQMQDLRVKLPQDGEI